MRRGFFCITDLRPLCFCCEAVGEVLTLEWGKNMKRMVSTAPSGFFIKLKPLRLLFLLLGISLFCASRQGLKVHAYGTYYGSSYDLGGTTYYNLSSSGGDAIRGTSYELGNTTYYNSSSFGSSTTSGSSYKLGDTTYYNSSSFGSPTTRGSSYDLGNTTYYNFSSQGSPTARGTSYELGNMTYYNLSSQGSTTYGSSYKLGETTYYNFRDTSAIEYTTPLTTYYGGLMLSERTFHKECIGNRCVEVAGEGFNECYSDYSCEPKTHKECVGVVGTPPVVGCWNFWRAGVLYGKLTQIL